MKISVKMTQQQMQGYGLVVAYRDFSIMLSVVEEPTSWHIGLRIGAPEGDDFILRLPAVNRIF